MGVLRRYSFYEPRKPTERTPLKIGPFGTHNDKPFRCTRLTIHTKIYEKGDETVAETEIQYTFRNDFRDAELYYPVSELSGIENFTLTLNDEDVRGRLNPFEVDSKTLPARVDIKPQGNHGDNPPIVYQCFKGDPTIDLDIGEHSLLVAKFSFDLPTTLRDAGSRYLWVLPLSILVKPPDQVTFSLDLKRKITGLKALVDDSEEVGIDLKRSASVGSAQARIPNAGKYLVPVTKDHILVELDLSGSGWVQSTIMFLIPSVLVVLMAVIGMLWYHYSRSWN